MSAEDAGVAPDGARQAGTLPTGEGLDGTLLEGVLRAVRGAGRLIEQARRRGVVARKKIDASPVTVADRASDRLLKRELLALAPFGWLSEETADSPDRLRLRRVWVVDPLDGTREFIGRNGEFTVNIALVRDGRPVFGVVHLPALDTSYWTAPDGSVLRRVEDGEAQPVRCRRPPPDGLVVVASRSHRDARTDEFLAGYRVRELVSAGSSLKLCRVAEGTADLYPRIGRTMEWDIAAGHAVVLAAGGSVETLDGAPLRYGKPGFDNPPFIARGLR